MKSSKPRNTHMTNYFDLSRLGLLMKMELFRSRRGLLMILVIIFGLLFTSLIAAAVFGENKKFESHPGNYTFNLIVGGLIISSLAYKDLGNTLRRYHYLTLPASSLEKFLSMWLLTGIGWITLYTVTYTIYTLFANAIGHLLFSHITFLSFNPLGEEAVLAVRIYIVLQGIMLVGAVHFKGYVFPKTLFTLIVFAAVCGIIAYLVMADILHSGTECTEDPGYLKESGAYQVWVIIQWLFWWVLAPLCWVVTYLGLKEQEA